MASEDEDQRRQDRRKGDRREADRRQGDRREQPAPESSDPDRERQFEQVRETQSTWAAFDAERTAERKSARGRFRRRRKTPTR
jgi:hypothetical protein